MNIKIDPRATDISNQRRTLVNSLSHKSNENTGGATKNNHFRTLKINQSHRLNCKSSIQEELLNLGTTVGSVTF